MEKREVFARMRELSDPRFAVATVIGTRGSTPREAGAKMVIRADGTFFGTIGGGCGEAEVWAQATRSIRTGEVSRVQVDLTESADEGGEKICGGKMDILVDLWERQHDPLLARLTKAMSQGDVEILITTVLSGEKKLLSDTPVDDVALQQAAAACIKTGRSRLVEIDGAEFFLEILERPPCLIIVGAGHVAQPLCRFGKGIGFRVAVLDDRGEWATRERFAEADEVLAGPVAENLRHFPMQAGTYVVLVTRGHRYDEEALRICLPYPLSYVGMIGSKRRVRAVFKDLEQEGWQPDLLDKVYSPIGIDIGAETPEEIAISILAEIIQVRRGGRGPSMRIRQGSSLTADL